MLNLHEIRDMDLQSDLLPTALKGQMYNNCMLYSGGNRLLNSEKVKGQIV